MPFNIRSGGKRGPAKEKKPKIGVAQAPRQLPAAAPAPALKPAPKPAPPALPRPFYGLKVFYNPKDNGLDIDLDLVFVHGLNGDHMGTWAHSTGVVWPKDLIPKKMPHARVLSFGYSANIYNNPSIGCVRDHARNLLDHLNDLRLETVGETSIPLVLVAHSLGGLVVKQALRYAKNERRFENISKATRGILLFGTPHHGTDNEDTWDRVAEGFWPLATAISSDGTTGRSSADRSPLVKALKRDSHVVLDISDDFRSLTTSYALVSFYETFAWPHTEAAIVPKSSALLGLAHEDQVPLAADHAEMVRFDGLDDPMFVQVERRIRKAAKGREREEEVERVENTKNRMPLTLEFGQMGSMMWTTKNFSDRYDIASQLSRSQV